VVGGPPIRVFYSYSHSDEGMLQSLRKHLAMLRRRGLISEWFDRDIEAGGEWRKEIAAELDAADLIVLLVSSDFLDSDFCYEEEMARALERSDQGEARVVAVMLRPVDGWDATPFAKLQVVPTNAVPVTKWPDQDEAFADVAAKTRRVVERLRQSHATSSQSAGGVSTEESAPSRTLDSAPDSAVTARRREIVTALEELLTHPDGAYIVLDADTKRNYYAQYLADEGGVWCEAVANEWIDPQYALGGGQMARLAELGWSPPEENIPNWWWAAPKETPLDEIADLTLRTLISVYGVDPSDAFTFTKSW
jgi:TIR domain